MELAALEKHHHCNGILVYLCTKIAERLRTTKIFIKTQEFYITKNDKMDNHIEIGEINKPIIINNPSNDKQWHEFKYDDNNITLATAINYTPSHKYRVKRVETSKTIVIDSSQNNIEIKQNTPLGECLEFLIDKDRFVKATTNNPNSSRSHSLVYIKFSLNGVDRYLILGDFAGVENKFDCENEAIVEQFLNIKRDNSKNTYYSDEMYTDVSGNTSYDPYLGGGDYKEYLKKTEPIYDFTTIPIREEFKQQIYGDLKEPQLQKIANVYFEIFDKKNEISNQDKTGAYIKNYADLSNNFLNNIIYNDKVNNPFYWKYDDIKTNELFDNEDNTIVDDNFKILQTNFVTENKNEKFEIYSEKNLIFLKNSFWN